MTTLRLFKHHVRVPFLLMGITESVIFFLAVYLGVYLRLDNLSTTITDMAPLIVRAMVFSIIMILSMIAVGLYQARLREGIFGLLLRMVASFFLVYRFSEKSRFSVLKKAIFADIRKSLM